MPPVPHTFAKWGGGTLAYPCPHGVGATASKKAYTDGNISLVGWWQYSVFGHTDPSDINCNLYFFIFFLCMQLRPIVGQPGSSSIISRVKLGQTTFQLRKRAGFDDVGHCLGLTTGASVSLSTDSAMPLTGAESTGHCLGSAWLEAPFMAVM